MDYTLLHLSWPVQVALGSGYAGYLLAYLGIRSDHKSIDAIFVSLAFSLIATAALYLLSHQNPIAAGAIAFLATIVSTLVWRAVIRHPFLSLMRHWNVSWADDAPSAWASFHENNKIPATQIGVELDDGTVLRCDHASDFNDAPYGPFVLGVNGDVALYATGEERVGREPKQFTTTRHKDGDLITYIPASRIRLVMIRYKAT